MRSKKVLATIALVGALAFATAMPAQAAKSKNVDLDGKYHATLGLKTKGDDELYRAGDYDDENVYGKPEWEKLAKGTIGSWDYSSVAGTFNEASIKGNGTYTVTLKNADYANETAFSQLYVSTDIPKTDKLTFSNMFVLVDGKTVLTYEEPVIKASGDSIVLLAIKEAKKSIKGIDNKGKFLPKNSKNTVKIQFTVSGFNYDNKKATAKVTPKPTATVEPTATPEPTATVAPSQTAKPDKSVKKETSNELSTARQAGIIGVIAIAILSIIGILIIVNKRKR